MIRPIASRAFNRLSAVEGIPKIHSLAAALILSAQLVSIDAIDGTVATWVMGDRVSTARRAASELAQNGAADRLDVLPLSKNERVWWKAIAFLTLQRFDDAIEQLALLPVDRYKDATGLLARCVASADARRGQLGQEALQRRLGSNGPGVAEAAADAAGLDRTDWVWLDEPNKPAPMHDLANVTSPAIALYRFVSAGSAGTPAHLLPPGKVPVAVLDDAVDLGATFVLSDTSASASEDVRRYLVARTHPESLSDDDVYSLDFDRERVRRFLAGLYGPGTKPPDVADAYLAALVALAQRGSVDASLREHEPLKAEALRRFLEEPDADTLNEDLAADESLWQVLSRSLDAGALGWNPARGTHVRRLLAWHALRTANSELFEARWDRALEGAKHVLRLSEDEGFRDEALNVMACAHWQLGRDEEAQRALTTALEGNRNASLQINLGVVAATLDPEAAALELARLVREAGSLELRVAAALRAVSLWLTDAVPWASEQADGMPEPLALALRSVVVEQIGLDDFRQILKLQSAFDDTWLTQPSSLTTSPHRLSVEASIYRARAAGPGELVDVLIEVLRRPGCPGWVADERDSLLNSFVRSALNDESSGAGLFAHYAIEKGLPIEPEQRDLLVPLAIHGICGLLADDDSKSAPQDRFTQFLADGEREARSHGTYERLGDLYKSAWTRLAVAHALFGQTYIGECAGAFDRLIGQIRNVPRRRLNMVTVRNAFGPIRTAAREVESSLVQFSGRVDDDNILTFVDQTLSNARLLATEAEKVMR